MSSQQGRPPPLVFHKPTPCICGFVPPEGSWNADHACWVTPDDVVRIVRAKNGITPHAFAPGAGAKGCKWCDKAQEETIHAR